MGNFFGVFDNFMGWLNTTIFVNVRLVSLSLLAPVKPF